MKFTWKEDGKRIIVICIAAFIMALNIKTFVRTGGLYPGGATGITILIQEIGRIFFKVELPYTILTLLINAFPIYIGFKFIGKKFTIYSCVMILLTGIFTDLIPTRILTSDMLLISVFGGMVNGFVISLCLRNDATTGGTDFIGIYLSDKKGMDSFNLVLGINIVILCTAGLLFGWGKALYSIIFQYASTQVLHALYRKYQKQTLFIVSNMPQEVCDSIDEISHHSATIIEGKGYYENADRYMIYSVVSSAEAKHVIRAVKKTDPKAFVNAMRTEQLAGRFYHKRVD